MGLVTVERRGGAAVVIYANPPAGTMTSPGAAEMLGIIKGLVVDPEVRSIIITGGMPGVFVRHYDVDEIVAGSKPEGGGDDEAWDQGQTYNDMLDLLQAAPKPVIAAINGTCRGGGFEMALACDLRIANEDVKAIGLPETRVGIFPGGGGTQRLPRVVGEAKALEMILRGLLVNGREAKEIGLVHEAVPDALARALEIAAEFDQRGAEGLAYAKRLVRSALDRPIAEGLADERRSGGEILKFPSAQAALRTALNPPAR